MFKFHNNFLPSYFDTFFTSIADIHTYKTRSAANQSYHRISLEQEQTMEYLISVFKDQQCGILEVKMHVKSTSCRKFKEKSKTRTSKKILMLVLIRILSSSISFLFHDFP